MSLLYGYSYAMPSYIHSIRVGISAIYQDSNLSTAEIQTEPDL